jgi:hypothetical protein
MLTPATELQNTSKDVLFHQAIIEPQPQNLLLVTKQK